MSLYELFVSLLDGVDISLYTDYVIVGIVTVVIVCVCLLFKGIANIFNNILR